MQFFKTKVAKTSSDCEHDVNESEQQPSTLTSTACRLDSEAESYHEEQEGKELISLFLHGTLTFPAAPVNVVTFSGNKAATDSDKVVLINQIALPVESLPFIVDCRF